MRLLLAATCLTPAAMLMAGQARADTSVSGSSNVATATVASGAADNVTVASGATLSPASGTAVTINSNNTITNAGTISFSGIDNTTAIGGGGGFASSIANSGTITVDETFVAVDTTSDGLVDAPFAQGTGRYGIHLTGSGAFTGTVNNSGTITVKGNNSGGIQSDVAIVGSVVSTGAITVTGDNSYGIKLGAVSGNVVVTGATAVTGQNSTAMSLGGDIGGKVVIHGSLTATGYTATTLPASTVTLVANDLLQGGPALSIGGNIAGGVLLAVAPTTTTDTTTDADGDGIVDSSEGTAVLDSYGTAPALTIGSASNAITIGTTGSGTAGLVNNGTIFANGVYAGYAATAVQIAGQGQTVTIANGITNTGSITATADAADATAIHLASGAIVPSLTNSGTIGATSTTADGGTATAILIDVGASLSAITNSATISAVPANSGGPAYAIRDLSGTLSSVTNTGFVISGSVAGSPAIDASANTTGFTYTQALASSTATAPYIVGAILSGSGNDQILASAGTLTSNISTGAGNDTVALSGTAALTGAATFGNGNDSLTLADTAAFTGTATFGTGADVLTIGSGTTFSGSIVTSASNLAVAVNGGTLSLTGSGTTRLASLSASGGTIGFNINPSTGAYTQLNVAGATTFTGATTIKVSLASLPVAASTSYTVIQSGTLSGSSNLNLSISTLPYLLTGSLAASDSSGTVAIDIMRKTAAALGLTRSEAAAYNAVYADIAGNSQLSSLFLSFGDRDSLLLRYRQMLPDHAGGVFDVLSQGVRNLAPSENVTPWAKLGGLSLWAQQGYWNATQDSVNTPGYTSMGWGLTAGGDVAIGSFGRVGLSVGYIFGDTTDASHTAVTSNDFQGGLYWLGDWGGFHLSASGSAGYVRNTGKRYLTSNDVNNPTLFTSVGKWNGLLISGIGKASYEAKLGHFFLRPTGTVSYIKLHEDGHGDSGGGSAFDLIVNARNSDELAATGTVAAGIQWGGNGDIEAATVRLELEGGRRQIVGGTIGSTTAHFADGASFTLLPEDRDSGYVGTARVSVGNGNFRFVGSASTETRSGYHTIVGRIGLRGTF
ncbi:autotransporter domain-containing protein [Sphingomonas nostoxanthinifaciens]|uniref:autotransporter domain-containing protein n=1 Tax=Sphingomonas nostoxanthinifaciens TaxID=2872652 RepID=UPI001CC1C4A1|nr:autotransporter domain-containing protein [Sphingomonas nostoxanthinifaciens]UAK24090.1 autotransporter outer membrane beta-barrel domain-containing protein [Sphingomonas nostoxanthinifaciens]